MANVVRKVVSTSAAPSSIGPFSQGIIVDNMVYVSGNVGFDPATMKVVEGGVKRQTEQTMKNIGEILKAAGSSFDNVVKTTILVTDMNDFAAINEVYASFFSGVRPARTTYQVSCLPAKEAKVEIEAVAVVGTITEGKL